MKLIDRLDKGEIAELLGKCWMAHDGMWFYNCFQEFGIEAANRLNRAAIKSLSPIEVNWIRNALHTEKAPVESFDAFKFFFQGVMDLFIPDFMNATMNFPEENVLHWEFKPGECFAYKGMRRIGAIDGYECGVIYRVGCWIETLGIEYTMSPEIRGCLMLADGACSGDLRLSFGRKQDPR